MKRSLDQITQSQDKKEELFFDESTKKRKLDTQRIGAFIVKANDAIHFRIVSAEDFESRDKYFGPVHSHQIFGENM